MKTWADIQHFRQEEFDCRDLPGTGVRMDMEFVALLDALRDRCGFPLVIHSGYRSPGRNEEVGGVQESAHVAGHAADIRALSSRTRFRIIEEALRLGIRRIGVGETFVHLDNDPTKPMDVVWLY